MTRPFFVASLIAAFALSAAAFAQTPKPKTKQDLAMEQLNNVPADEDPRQAGTEQQRCQMECGAAMQKCMMPCMGGNPDEAAKPENRGKTMGCVKKCADAQDPCMKACDSKKKTK